MKRRKYLCAPEYLPQQQQSPKDIHITAHFVPSSQKYTHSGLPAVSDRETLQADRPASPAVHDGNARQILVQQLLNTPPDQQYAPYLALRSRWGDPELMQLLQQQTATPGASACLAFNSDDSKQTSSSSERQGVDTSAGLPAHLLELAHHCSQASFSDAGKSAGACDACQGYLSAGVSPLLIYPCNCMLSDASQP